MAIEKILTRCAYCKSILIDDKNRWLAEKEDPELYELSFKLYKQISDGCCPKCESDVAKQYGIESIPRSQ
jgi:hypothetical protein